MNEELIELFLSTQAAEHGAGSNTLEAYNNDLQQWMYFYDDEPKNLTADDISDFAAFLNARGYEPASISRKMSALSDFCKFLFSEGIIKENPLINLDRPKKKQHLPKFLTREEITTLIEAAEYQDDNYSKRAAVMLKLMYACGLRVSELVSLPLNCINENEKQLLVKGKGAKERVVPIADEALYALHRWRELRELMLHRSTSRYLFPSCRSTCGHITRSGFFRGIKKLAQAAQIAPERVSPHILRHSFATHLLESKVDLRSLQAMLGHEDITTTQIYTHIVPNSLITDVISHHPLSKKTD
ncbi:MAG: tyrosine recombinase [Alphaproteobacteria bacterium]|nr:tyrosine recombinase [Alphaproteobacteria bacterium]